MVPVGRWRTGFAACCWRMASSSARCSAVRVGLMVGFMASLLLLGDIVSRDRADDERIGQVQHLEHNGDKATRPGTAKSDGSAGRVARVERRVFVVQGELDLFRRQAVF